MMQTSTYSKLDLFKLKNKYGKVLRCPNIHDKYDNKIGVSIDKRLSIAQSR